jgi:hypothetical protein
MSMKFYEYLTIASVQAEREMKKCETHTERERERDGWKLTNAFHWN